MFTEDRIQCEFARVCTWLLELGKFEAAQRLGRAARHWSAHLARQIVSQSTAAPPPAWATATALRPMD